MTNETGEIKTRRAAAFMGNLVAALGLLVIGYPLAPPPIRTMVLGWSLMVIAIMQSVLRHHFQATEIAVIIRDHVGIWTGRERYR